MKIAIVCYSFEGNTLEVAQYLSKELKADLIEIKPVKEIQSKGFSKFFWGGKQVIFKEKPALIPITQDLDSYDVIFVGSPIWAGTYAPPIKTFLEEGVVKNKAIAYFYTHEGGHKSALQKGRKGIEKFNRYLGCKDIMNVMKDHESWKEPFLLWAKEVIDTYYNR